MFNMKIGKSNQETSNNELTQIKNNQPSEQAEFSEISSQETVSLNDPVHFDELIGSAPDEKDGYLDGSTPNIVTSDDFHSLFCVGFGTASALTGLQSLNVDKEDPAAQECTKALYETIVDIPALRFILMPQGKWCQRAVAIGAFTIPMAIGVSAEIKAKKAQIMEQPEAPEQKGQSMPLGATLREQAQGVSA